MRRRSDGWLNATQILKVAGVDKGKRTKVLEKEILPGEHEKVQGGYGKYQGTWISYQRGREFCRQYGVEDLLRPLLDYDVSADGSSGPGAQETPTKEQAMAAQRKKFYNTGAAHEPRQNGQQQQSNGTFFSNISPTTSVALAAMNKAARLNSPRARPTNMRQHSSQQDPAAGQYGEAERLDSGYNTQPNGEPPRKRMRTDDQDMGPPELPLDASMRSMTPTEPNESFMYEHALMQESVNGAGEPIALPPLLNPTTEEQQEKMNLILDLFAEQGRTDYASHPALQQLTNEDFNMPLDASANNALHWAATLAKVPLLRLLIQKGASIWRGNAAGQSPLISAVLVSNCWEHSCFPEVLELLGPLIEVRDVQGRTILHHIAVSSGIKGRQPCSKYYLEALLEFLVRIGTQSTALNAGHDALQANGESSSQDSRGPVSLVRFLSHIVNARDKAGNTALNLVARIGNRSIIQQLLEIHADPSLPNNKGVCAKDFGVGVEPGEQPYPNGGLASQQSIDASNIYPSQSSSDPAAADGEATVKLSQAEDLGQDFMSCVYSSSLPTLQRHLLT
jgi:ankyrin repeat protein